MKVIFQHMARRKASLSKVFPCREKTIEIGNRTLVMGILNVTPDSFSDGGRYNQPEKALQHALQMIEQGADLIDIGGESTRPGYTPVSIQDELERIIPVIRLLSEKIDVPISVDTYKAEVAKQALSAGAHIINDIWGLKRDPEMARVAAEYEAPVIVMHNRDNENYTDVISDVISDLKESIQIAHAAGIKDENIWLDPGIGFAKSIQDNFVVMNHLSEIVNLGYPVVLGTSRKSMIWKTLNRRPDEIVPGTAATVALGIAQGCQIIRVHDIEEMAMVAQFTDALLRS